MSWQTAIGRFYQLNPEALKAERTGEIRCSRGCLLATAVQLAGERVLIVRAHTTTALPGGAMATAPVEDLDNRDAEDAEDALSARVSGWSGTDALEALKAGNVTEAELEALFRSTGGDVRQLAYVATRADLMSGGNAWTFTRCRHVRGYLGPEHWNNAGRRPLKVATLPLDRSR